MGAVAKKGWQQYMLQLHHHPLRTKAITAGVLAAISDSVAQKLSGIQKLQLRRLLLKVLFGFAYGGPFGHFLHKLLDKIFKGKKDTKTVAKKVLLEQLTSSPWNNIVFMLYFGLVVEGRTWNQVRNKIKKDYPSVQLTSWMVSMRASLSYKCYSCFVSSFTALLLAAGIGSACTVWGIFLNLRARSIMPAKK